MPMDVFIVGGYRFSYCPGRVYRATYRLLSVPIDALKVDLARFRKTRTPAYRNQPTEKEVTQKVPDRLTIVEEDLLFVLLHDDRLASPLAHTLDISWVDSRPVSGRILAKILSETNAEGSVLSRSQIEDLLEDDQERDLYHRLVMQEIKKMNPDSYYDLPDSASMSSSCDILKDRKTLSLLS